MSQLHYKRCGSMGCDPRIEELLQGSKSGALQLEGTRLRDAAQLEQAFSGGSCLALWHLDGGDSAD